MKADDSLVVRAARGIHRRARSRIVGKQLQAAGVGEAHQIKTFTSKEELEALYTLGLSCPPDARVLEIGSYLGASTCYLGAAIKSRGGRLWCVDTWQNETMPEGVRDTFSEFKRNTAGIESILVPVRKRSDSITIADFEVPLNLAFIDGDHSYAATKSDFACIANHVADDGVVVFHDTLFFEGPSRVVGECLASGAWCLGGIAGNMTWIRKAHFAHIS